LARGVSGGGRGVVADEGAGHEVHAPVAAEAEPVVVVFDGGNLLVEEAGLLRCCAPDHGVGAPAVDAVAAEHLAIDAAAVAGGLLAAAATGVDGLDAGVDEAD